MAKLFIDCCLVDGDDWLYEPSLVAEPSPQPAPGILPSRTSEFSSPGYTITHTQPPLESFSSLIEAPLTQIASSSFQSSQPQLTSSLGSYPTHSLSEALQSPEFASHEPSCGAQERTSKNEREFGTHCL